MSKKTFLNFENHQESFPDLFMGEDLGLTDYVNVTYPELEKAALDMRSKFWTENEVDLSADKLQWASLPTKIQEIVKLNLGWQSYLDSLASRAPELTLMALCTNPELELWYINQIFNESIHARTYMHIIRTIFPDPQGVMAEIRENTVAHRRAKVIVREFDKLFEMQIAWHRNEITSEELRVQVIKVLFVMYVLEGVQFFSSFAMNFALSEQGIMTGLADNLRMIARDEIMHRNAGYKIITILLRKPEWRAAFEEAFEDISRLFKEAIQSEIDWAHYVMNGREIVGLNAELLEDFIHYLAYHLADTIDFEYEGKIVKTNPLHWFHKYVDPSSLQTAPQEKQNVNYKISSIDTDIGDEIFDF